jgi:hypothetical protein
MALESPPSTADAAQHWYQVVQGTSLRQGDIIRNLPVFFLEDNQELTREDNGGQIEVAGKFDRGDWIIVSPSCDLDTERTNQAVLALCVSATMESLKAQGQTDMSQKLQVVRQGLDPSRMLLPEHTDEPKFPLSFVTNLRVGVLPPSAIKRFVGDGRRLRLKHPFREMLGNWCGQWISRVGPENDTLLPRFAKVYPKHILDQNES